MLKALSHDIKHFPPFMRKVRMIMIPSVGYFTSISKCEAAYCKYLDEEMRELKHKYDTINEDSLLDHLLGDILREYGWKISFITETDIYF